MSTFVISFTNFKNPVLSEFLFESCQIYIRNYSKTYIHAIFTTRHVQCTTNHGFNIKYEEYIPQHMFYIMLAWLIQHITDNITENGNSYDRKCRK